MKLFYQLLLNPPQLKNAKSRKHETYVYVASEIWVLKIQDNFAGKHGVMMYVLNVKNIVEDFAKGEISLC